MIGHHHFQQKEAPVTRETRTPTQRAEQALGVADRRVDKIAAEVGRLMADLADAEARLQEATVVRDYAAKNPALPQHE